MMDKDIKERYESKLKALKDTDLPYYIKKVKAIEFEIIYISKLLEQK